MSDASAAAGPKDSDVQAALREYLERVDRGEVVDRETFLSKHSEIAEKLRSFIAAEEQLRRLAGAERVERSTKSFALDGQETMAPRAGTGRSGESGTSGLKQEFGRYRILKALGKGAMGMVYLAEDTQLQRHVALKTPHFEQEPTADLLERFYREARSAATLRHPNICPVYDVGQIEGTHYISMAYIEGHPLSAFIRSDKPQPERQILIIVRKLAQALQEAHNHGIVHRDLKPANIMVDKRNEPIIMDFGLARQLQREDKVRITQSGMLIGTPAYMSPEQIDGEPDKVGPASDQYSLGVILYELLTAQLPFRGSLSTVMAQILTKDPTPPSQLRPDLDLRIEALCLKVMAKDPANRFASLAAVAEELTRILRTPKERQTAPHAAKASGTQGTPATPGAGDANVATSGIRQSVTRKSPLASSSPQSVAAKNLESLEELARKCLARHDYDQVIQIIERIPESKRTGGLVDVLAAARNKADEISFLICEIDEAVRFKDRATVLRKADELLKIKPGHHRALQAKEDFTGFGKGGAARLGPLATFTQPWTEGGWIPWGVFAFGLAVAGVVYAIVVIQLGKTAVVIDIQDPGISVAIADKGRKIEIITGPGESKVEVEPGEQELKITYAGLEARTQRFELKSGQKRRVTVSLVNKIPVVKLDQESLPLIDNSEKSRSSKPRPSDESPKVAALANQASRIAKKSGNLAPPPPVLAAPFDRQRAGKSQEEWARALAVPVQTTNTLGMALRVIPPGRFIMGSRETPEQLIKAFRYRGREMFAGEGPAHSVTITRPFYIGQYEVTLNQFQSFVDATGYQTDPERTKQGGFGRTEAGEVKQMAAFNWRNVGPHQERDWPVTNISFNDANAFCAWLSQKEGKRYRLPSEAEWEYACRAGTEGRYYNGDDPGEAAKIANVAVESVRNVAHPVGQLPPNQFNLYDMLGNASEWCADWYGEDYYATSPQSDPQGPSNGDVHVHRGGSWYARPDTARCARRGHDRDPISGFAWIGFRVVREVDSDQNGPAADQAASTTAPAPAKTTADGFVSLFNGRDLTGWKTHPSQPGNWRVENGVLIGSGADASHLYTERGDYTDFHLRVEARIASHGNSGLDFRTTFGPQWPANAPKFPFGYEAQIDNDNHRDRTGSLFVMDGGGGSGSAVVRVRNSRIRPGEWFTMEVIAHGQHIEIKLNGKKVAARDDSHFATGHIGLQQLERETVVEFRKIEIKEPGSDRVAAPPADASAPQHFVPLFNGHDLSGWKTHPSQPGNWRVENGLLVGSGPGSPSHLYTERGDYKDFHLRIEARVNERGNSGVYYRAKFGPKHPAKQPRWLLAYNAKLDESRLGAFLLDNGAAKGPLMVRSRVPQPPAGRWVVLDVIVRGNHIVIKTDGQITADYTDQKRQFASGYIALQQHTEKTRVEFRKVEIEELDSTAPDPSAESNTQLTPTPGFVSLFNGRDLTGWQTRPGESPDWHVEHGILTGGLPGGSSFLYSERGNYKDFHLRVEARIKEDANTELWIRTPKPADGKSAIPEIGYKIEMREPSDDKQNRTGSIWAIGRKDGHITLSGFGRHDRVVRPGEWFTLEVIAKGNHTVILVNGKGPTNNRWNQRDTYRNGAHLAFEQNRDNPPVEIRRVEIQEFAASKESADNSNQPGTSANHETNLLVNGSFDAGPTPGDFASYDPGSKAITGWTVTRGQIDLLGANRSTDGPNSVDLHGSPGYGGIKQKFDTAKGRRYRVTFALAVNPEAAHPVKKMGASAAKTAVVFTTDAKSKWWDQLHWTTKTFDFTATAAATTLEFYTLDNSDPVAGPLIDRVRVIELAQK